MDAGTPFATVAVMAIEKTFDIPIPIQDVQVRWREIQATRGAKVHFSPVDEQHTRVRVSANDDAGIDVEKIMDDLRAAGLFGGGKPGTT